MSEADWPGTREERQEQRAQQMGDVFLELYWGTTGEKEKADFQWWIDIIVPRSRRATWWLWSRKQRGPPADTTPMQQQARARIAGRVMLEAFAKGEHPGPSDFWFRKVMATVGDLETAWVFDEECLRADGWVSRKEEKGRVVWSRPEPVNRPDRP